MAALGEFSGSILVSDASVLINDRSIDRMDLIAAVSYEFMVTDHVADEIYALAIDDRRATLEAAARSDLEIVRTQDLIASMIKQNLLSIAEADAIKGEWEQRHRFRLTISSFAELLP